MTMNIVTSGGVYPHFVEVFNGTTRLAAGSIVKGAAASGINFVFNQANPSQRYDIRVTDAICATPTTGDITLNEATNRFENLRLEAIDYGLGYHVRCNGGSDGRIKVNVDGGVDDFTYYISADDPAFVPRNVTITSREHTFNGLRATTTGGALITYSIYVEDALDCRLATQTINLNQPTTITIGSATLVDYNGFEIPCNGFDVPVELQITGGARIPQASANAPPYAVTLTAISHSNYSSNLPAFSDATDQFTFSNVIAGTYQVTVEDFFGNTCQQVVNPYFTAVEPPPLTLNVISTRHPECLGHADGRVELRAAGGVPFAGAESYTFEIVDSTLVTPLYRPRNYSSTVTGGDASFSLPAGDFRARVTDINDCQTFVNFTIPVEPDPIRLSVDALSKKAQVKAVILGKEFIIKVAGNKN